MKIIINDRILIPKELLEIEDLESRYNINIFKENLCKKCDNLQERKALGGPNDLCEQCPNFIASYKLWQETEDYWSVPQGDELVIKRMFPDIKIVDKRKEIPFSNDIKFTAKLFGPNYIDENGYPRVDQQKLTTKFMKYKSGILCCRPRSGKTAMSINISIQLGQKTIILAHKKALLRQFYNTLTRSEPFPFTNIAKLQENTKKPIVLWAKTRPQLNKYKNDCDFLLVNYQKFVRKPEELAELVNGRFSTIIVDEAHNSGADGYLRVVAKCNFKHRIGLSATPKRKDGKHSLISLIMGPVVAKSESVSLIPRITLVKSNVKPETNYKQWHSAISFIFSSKKRNTEIVNKVIEDIKSGHKAVIIPVDHLKHQETLQKMFNKIKPDLAVCWNEKADEEAILKRVESQETTVLIAIRSMIREGVDLLRPSCMHVVVPMTAEQEDSVGAPMFDQLVNRICTPAPNKKEPIVRLWVDNVKMFQGCMKSLFFGEIWPNKYNPSKKKGKYNVDKDLVKIVSGLGREKQLFKREWS